MVPIFFSVEAWLLVVIVCLICYYFANEKLNYFSKRNIPHEKPYFPFGNAFSTMVFKDNIVTLTTKLYRKFPNARIIGFYQGLTPGIIVRDPEIVQRVLIKDFSHFHDRGINTDEETNPLDGHLFNMEGRKWKTLRKKLTPVFTSGKLKAMFHLMDECVEQFIAQLDKEIGGDVEIKEAFCRLTTDVIGSCAFGIDPAAIKDPNCEFRKMGRRLFNPNLPDAIRQLIRFTFPSYFAKMKMKTFSDDVNDFFYNITKQNFEIRLKERKKRNDFTQLLLELRERGNVSLDSIEREDAEDAYLFQGEQHVQEGETFNFTDNILAAQVFIFFFAGFETSATGMSFVMYFMSKYPEIQDKLREEVRKAKTKFGSFTYDALKSMEYLDACIHEAIRLYPLGGTLFRKCNKTLKIDNEITIDEGLVVFIPSNALGKDPTYFPDPESFKPERHIDKPSVPGTFMPFGDGPRICIAQRFALMELKLTIAKIIDRYRIDYSEKMRNNEPLKLNMRQFIPTPVNGLYVRLSKFE